VNTHDRIPNGVSMQFISCEGHLRLEVGYVAPTMTANLSPLATQCKEKLVPSSSGRGLTMTVLTESKYDDGPGIAVNRAAEVVVA
jgi:hypothetical protein